MLGLPHSGLLRWVHFVLWRLFALGDPGMVGADLRAVFMKNGLGGRPLTDLRAVGRVRAIALAHTLPEDDPKGVEAIKGLAFRDNRLSDCSLQMRAA